MKCKETKRNRGKKIANQKRSKREIVSKLLYLYREKISYEKKGGKQHSCVPKEGFHVVRRDARSRLQVNNLHVWWGGVGWGGVREKINTT